MFRIKPEVVAARPSAFAALYRSEDVMVKILGVRRKPAPSERRQKNRRTNRNRWSRRRVCCSSTVGAA